MVRKLTSRFRKLERRVIITLLLIIPLFALGASFFVIAAAQENASADIIQLWNENKAGFVAAFEENGAVVSDIGGVIQFDDKNQVPFYSTIGNVKDGAAVFGQTLPGQIGRTIIMGHNEQDFTYLSKIQVGDEIVVDSFLGECVYTVISCRVVVPSEIPFDDTEESVLTLVSQYPFRAVTANRRYVVEAVLN